MTSSASSARQIGIVLFDGVEELDAVGPWEVLAHWTRSYPEDGYAVLCVSVVYAAAGLLARRPATTHWGAVDELRALDSSVELREHERWVDDGDLITSAGVSAGIDMGLHVVARVAGRERAREVRRGIQYDPQPPV